MSKNLSRSTISALLKKTNSKNDYEALAAIRHANNLLVQRNLTWEDVIYSPQPKIHVIERKVEVPKSLSAREKIILSYFLFWAFAGPVLFMWFIM